eukprot:m.480414 g.480414  ORF g.480414 m.480414 type:complete len:229 (+) comp21707_c0_seq24:265-951(+)
MKLATSLQRFRYLYAYRFTFHRWVSMDTSTHAATCIEIEQRFAVDDQSESKVVSAGARFVGKQTHLDVYFDTRDNDLCLSDTWLRKRNQRWQLKSPQIGAATPGQPGMADAVQQRLEIDAEENIMAYFNSSNHVVADQLLKFCNLDSAVENGFLAVLVDVTTTRTTYTLNGAEIVFDVVWYDQGSRTSDTLGDPAHTIGEVLFGWRFLQPWKVTSLLPKKGLTHSFNN